MHVTFSELQDYNTYLHYTIDHLPPDWSTSRRTDELTTESLLEFNSRPDSLQLIVLGTDQEGKVVRPEFILELSLRCVHTVLSLPVRSKRPCRMISGCGASMDLRMFCDLLEQVAFGEHLDKATRARAFSIMAYAYRRTSYYNNEDEDGSPEYKMLCTAVYMAQNAAELDFFSQAMMAAGEAFEEAGYRRDRKDAITESYEGMSREDWLRHVSSFDAFWKAYDRRRKVYEKRKEPKLADEKVSCDAGCGVISSKPRVMRRCGGKCPMQFKPVYCSKSCQKLVRTRP